MNLDEILSDLPDRLTTWSIDTGTGCWIWGSNLDHQGYGRAQFNGKPLMAHRFLYELLVGPIPDGLEIDHLCRNRACVNPSHLEPVTHCENVLRGESPIARNARKTHCSHGHLYDEANTHYYVTRSQKAWRDCRACAVVRSRRYRDRQKRPL